MKSNLVCAIFVKKGLRMTLQEMFEKLISEAHGTAVEKGWHEKEVTVPHALMMVVDEVAEMMHEYRVKAPQEFVYREMADVFIRLFDFMGQQKFDVPQFVKALEEKMKPTKDHIDTGQTILKGKIKRIYY